MAEGRDSVMGGIDFARPATLVAPDLIGVSLEAHGVRGRIVETEAYQGEEDRACHARAGRTRRTEVLYRQGGTIYVYLVYGLHVLLNLVCDQVDSPAAVLIRALEIADGEELARARRGASIGYFHLADGPAKVSQALGLDLGINGRVLGERGCPLRILPDRHRPRALGCGRRVGIAYAGPEWADRPWRWWDADFPIRPQP